MDVIGMYDTIKDDVFATYLAGVANAMHKESFT